jgi:hypothetical protein
VASLREAILDELVTRLDGIGDGWSAAKRGDSNVLNATVSAIVYQTGETKLTESITFKCTLAVSAEITVNEEDADDTIDGGNVYTYLDRMVADAERAIHGALWPDGFNALVRGHTPAQPDQDTRAAARLDLEVKYEHNIEDPDTFNPSYP